MNIPHLIHNGRSCLPNSGGGYSRLKGWPFNVKVSSKGVGLATAALTQQPFLALRSMAATLAGSSGDSISYLVSTFGAPARMVPANTEPVMSKWTETSARTLVMFTFIN